MELSPKGLSSSYFKGDLIPCIPFSFKGEGELSFLRGAWPLLDSLIAAKPPNFTRRDTPLKEKGSVLLKHGCTTSLTLFGSSPVRYGRKRERLGNL